MADVIGSIPPALGGMPPAQPAQHAVKMAHEARLLPTSNPAVCVLRYRLTRFDAEWTEVAIPTPLVDLYAAQRMAADAKAAIAEMQGEGQPAAPTLILP